MNPRRALLVLLALAVAACGPAERPRPAPLDAPLPERLSELGLLRRDAGLLRPVDGVAYDLGHPLFSDYARKYRTLHLPPGAAARPAGGPAATLDFPVGTRLTKTFYYPVRDGAVVLAGAASFAGPDAPLATAGVRLLETRVLRRTRAGWEGVSYVWDASGREAFRARAGDLFKLVPADGEPARDPFDYLVPDVNQCAGCHATDHGSGALAPIGPKPGNLAAVALPVEGAGGARNQYADWRAAGRVVDAAVAPWPAAGTGAARAYLDANCAHCHSDAGAADTAGLDLRYDAPMAGPGLCKPPVAAGRGSGGLDYDIVPGRPDESILVHRLGHRDPGVMMPELGRSLVHREGLALVRSWIAGMEGDCGAARLL